MTSDDSFLEAIRADPDDDTVRLIYADWLQEQDELAWVERGEFIRVQCELARLSPGDSRRGDLEAREEALLARNWHAWVGPLRDLIGESSWESWQTFRRQAVRRFRRGFVEDLTLPACTFLARGADLFRLTPLRHLSLVRAGPHAAALASCPFLSEIEALRFVDYFVEPLDAGGAVHLSESSHLNRLRSLSLYNNNIGLIGTLAIAIAPWLAALIDLHLGACGLGDRGAEVVAYSMVPQRLRRLDLSDNGITDQGARALARSAGLFRLRELVLANNLITGEGQRVLLQSPTLMAGRYGLQLRGNPCLVE